MVPRTRRFNNSIALEVINIQDASFGQDLEAIIETITTGIRTEDMSYDDIQTSPELKSIEILVLKRLGLKINLISNSGNLAAVLPFYSNVNHTLVDKWARGNFSMKDQERVLKSVRDKKGTVDLVNAKVGGLFSTYNSKVWFNIRSLVLDYNCTNGELVAVLLHELGHAFYACEYSDRIDSTNRVLDSVVTELHKDPVKRNHTYIYKELTKLDKDITQEAAEVLANESGVIVGRKLFKMTMTAVNSQMPVATYDETAFEQLADNFATRFGYGRQLVTSLDKLSDYFGNPEKSVAANVFNTILSTIGSIIVTSVLIASLAAGPAVTLLAFFYITGLLFISGTSGVDHTYDELKVRYKRVRNEYLSQLKSSDLDKTIMSDTLDKIYALDEIIKNTHVPVSAFRNMSDLLFPSNRAAKQNIAEQQELENLAFNDLFLKSAELKLNS